MDVAIIGAGLSGLACAHELEKHGIRPVIYEKNGFIGGQISHVASFLQITTWPVKDALHYIHDKFDIDIQPLNTINSIIHRSPDKTVTMRGDLGYFILRGREGGDLANQIHTKLKNTEFKMNQHAHYDTLKDQYDYVIIAIGNPSMTDELGCWQEWFRGCVRGATVLGSFDPNTQIMWINKNYCKNGYACLAPFGRDRATIVLVVSDVNENEIDFYWEEFLYAENIKYVLVEEFKLQHITGYAYPHKLDNLYFVGNAGGAIDSFLGFGQFSSIEMGVMAARSIANGENYEQLIKHIVKRNTRFHKFRKAFNGLTNEDYDDLIQSRFSKKQFAGMKE